MILLDSTFLIDFTKKQRIAQEKLKSLEQRMLFTTRINTFELLAGLFSLRSETEKAIKLSEVQMFLSRLIILELDEISARKAAEIYGQLNRKGSSIGHADSLIAGIALTNGIGTIVSRNIKDFEKIDGIKVETY